ncbi:hypothetical protein AMR72_00215 [Flavobacterium psychrophilum]|nr:hypothetical protein AMR72_00215 [Flavobacterium psychrophilum]AOE51075.1 hypothetical protein ALW18_00215 [Flavobacterium psychrophilum]
MKKLIFLFVLALVFLSCETKTKEGAVLVSPQQFSQEIAMGTVQLVDVRTPEEFNNGHIKGAQNINLHDDDFANQINKLHKDKTVYVYCKAGRRSAEATATLKQNGFKNVVELDGGTNAWSDAGQPLIK